jgi:hypothetical protein
MDWMEWGIIGLVAIVALAGQVWSLRSIEHDRERDEHEDGLSL